MNQLSKTRLVDTINMVVIEESRVGWLSMNSKSRRLEVIIRGILGDKIHSTQRFMISSRGL